MGGIVYGCAKASTESWGSLTTLGSLLTGIALVAVFVYVQWRSEEPLLPLRVVLDRDRGGSVLVMGLIAMGMFGIFLFLTYYLELTLALTPVLTGIAFLPLTLSIMVGSTLVGGKLQPVLGARTMVIGGGVAASVGMALLTRIDVHTTYWVVVMPALIVTGLGLGSSFGSAISTSTLGVAPEDAGVASAVANTAQQIGGSIGTALLSTLSARVVSSYAITHAHVAGAGGLAIVHGYRAVFWASSACFLVAAIVGGLLLNRRSASEPAPRAAPVVAAHCALIAASSPTESRSQP